MQILVTCFEAFAGRRRNLSAMALHEFACRRIVRSSRGRGAMDELLLGPVDPARGGDPPWVDGGLPMDDGSTLHCRLACLPVSFRRVGPALDGLLGDGGPWAVLMLGEAGGRDKVQVERIALNVAHSDTADNDGHRPSMENVCPRRDAPLARMSLLDCAGLVERLNGLGHSAAVSHHAGTFVCNAAYYQVLARTERALFVHLPIASSPAAPGGSHGASSLADEHGRGGSLPWMVVDAAVSYLAAGLGGRRRQTGTGAAPTR